MQRDGGSHWDGSAGFSSQADHSSGPEKNSAGVSIWGLLARRMGRATPNRQEDTMRVMDARVAADGTLEPGDSGRQNKNVVAGNVEHDVTTGPGHYCFGGLPFAVASAMVSFDSAGNIDLPVFTSVAVQRGITLGN